MEWKVEQDDGAPYEYWIRGPRIQIRVLATYKGWRGYAWISGGPEIASDTTATADEAKAAIVAKVREILEKELEALR